MTNGQNSRTGYHQKYTITKTSTGKHLKETLPIVKEIVNHMRFHRGINMSELIVDFIKDEDGNWWVTDVKAFKYTPKNKCALGSPSQHLLTLG